MTKEELNQRLDELWWDARCAATYQEVIDCAQIWLLTLWPHALRLGYAPRGKGYSETLLCQCPRIFTRRLGTGIYGQFNGIHIEVNDWSTMRKIKAGLPAKTQLRDTILHETQHALDSLRSLPKNLHDGWFGRRLAKLQTAFPPDEGR